MIVQWFGLSALDVVLCNWYPRTSLSLPYPHFPHFYYNLQLDLSYLWCPAFTFHVYCRILRYWPKHCPPTLTWLTWMSATTPSEMEASPSSLNTSRQESCTPIHMCTLHIRSTHTHTHTHTPCRTLAALCSHWTSATMILDQKEQKPWPVLCRWTQN